MGRLDRIKELVQNTDPYVLSIKLATQKGVFGYTVLHEAVASRNTEILDYLLEQTEAASVNSTAKSGYTPLHMAASSGLADSVRVLLKHDADVNCTDEYGRTPRSAARLSSKHETEKLLFSEGRRATSVQHDITCVWVYIKSGLMHGHGREESLNFDRIAMPFNNNSFMHCYSPMNRAHQRVGN